MDGMNNNPQTENNNAYQQNTQSYNTVPAQNSPDFTLWLVLGIIQICMICCCNCLSLITGTITVVLVILANNSYKAGNLADHDSKIKIAKIVNLVGWGLFVVNIIINLVGGVFSSVMSAIGAY